ncbi:hypothetical protein B0H34DRAFT_738480 [Crassisporium funariophilum]|nr:hypothetical protein B0H34DRAFT_738480 [Crassisporium funariophilum]
MGRWKMIYSDGYSIHVCYFHNLRLQQQSLMHSESEYRSFTSFLLFPDLLFPRGLLHSHWSPCPSRPSTQVSHHTATPDRRPSAHTAPSPPPRSYTRPFSLPRDSIRPRAPRTAFGRDPNWGRRGARFCRVRGCCRLLWSRSRWCVFGAGKRRWWVEYGVLWLFVGRE